MIPASRRAAAAIHRKHLDSMAMRDSWWQHRFIVADAGVLRWRWTPTEQSITAFTTRKRNSTQPQVDLSARKPPAHCSMGASGARCPQY